MEKSRYSGKAGRHTAKTQYTVNVYGLIIHNTRHSPGCVHDFKAYKTKHPTFPKNLPSRDGSAREGKRANLRSYGDRGYQGAQKVDPDVEAVLPIRCKPGKKLSPEERKINRRNCSPHIIRQTINVSSIGRRLDTKLHEQMKICVNSMLCLMVRPQIHLPNVKTCLDVVNTYQQAAVRDSGPCGKCDPPDQNPPDHGGQIPKSAEKV